MARDRLENKTEDFMRDLEANLQYEYMDKAKEYVAKKSAELGRPLTFCVVTFGCPMV